MNVILKKLRRVKRKGESTMLFHVYGSNAVYQWIAMLAVLAGLILLNEFSRRTKWGGLFMFGVVPAILTIYFVVIAVAAKSGAGWALQNLSLIHI